MRSFASDNNSAVSPQIMDALHQANSNHAFGYGDDAWTRSAEALFKVQFGADTETLFVFNGTGANSVALQLLVRSYHSILCAETAHIYVDECGAPCRMTGAQIRPIATPDGKLTPELIMPYLKGFGDHHHSQPKVIYLSQCTELGTIYTIEEIKAIAALAQQYEIYLHMDGARIANAAAYLGVSLKALSAECGIDVLSFGGTKNGMMMGEGVVILNPKLHAEARFIRKQSAQLSSKMRYLACQFTAYFENQLWLTNARHANQMAQLLKEQLLVYPQIRFTQVVESNALFLQMPRVWIDELLKEYQFYFWNEEQNEIRLVTSFDTTLDDIERFSRSLRLIAHGEA